MIKELRPDKVAEHIIKNACLITWAILLAFIGMQAVSGKASTTILNFAETIVPNKKSQNSFECPSLTYDDSKISDALTQLCYYNKEYLKKEGVDETDIPPIAIVLDRLQLGVSWRDPKKIEEVNGGQELNSQDYKNLFDIVAKRLNSLAQFSPDISVGSGNLKINNNIVPFKFRKADTFKEQDTELPPEAILWVKTKQTSIESRKSQLVFLDLFILLIILGGFGSWIYLLRRYFDKETKTRLVEYFYRPPLGMALAIGVFIVNLSVHSFISDSGIKEVRKETLILLAFAAGLLSDKTYEFIEEEILRKHDDNQPNANDNQQDEPRQNDS